MTLRELDRLVTKTEITPASKRALKEVRRIVQSGIDTRADMTKTRWTVALDTQDGLPVKMSFSWKRE